MKQIKIIFCLLSLLAPIIRTAVACDTETNCEGVGEIPQAFFKESIEDQREILAVLFDLPKKEVENKTFYEYNYYTWNCTLTRKNKHNGEKKCVYKGGHAGWDVQTRDRSKEQIFYSLTTGIVVMDGKRNKSPGDTDTFDEKNFNAIAVYDEDNDITTFYLHASAVDPSIKKGDKVKVCDPLGKQGDTGSPGAVHVHLEVQVGKAERASAGTKDPGTQTMDPIPHLHKSIQSRPFKIRVFIEMLWGKVKSKLAQ